MLKPAGDFKVTKMDWLRGIALLLIGAFFFTEPAWYGKLFGIVCVGVSIVYLTILGFESRWFKGKEEDESS